MSLISRFGVGCFIFSVIEHCEDLATWKWLVKQELNSLSTIESVSLEVDDDAIFVSRGPSQRKDVPAGEDGAQVLQPWSGRLSFTVSISRRIQHELTESGYGTRLRAEKFRVDTFYQYFGPVTFVTCIDSSPEDEHFPSDAVKLVREFLRSELQKKSDKKLSLAVTGPSPFHADFGLSDDSSEAHADAVALLDFDALRLQLPGYDEVIFTLTDETSLAIESAHDELIYYLADEFSLFYFLTRSKVDRMYQALACMAQAQELINHYQKLGLKARLGRVFKSGADARDLLLGVISAEASATAQVQGNRTDVQDLEGRGFPLLFDKESRDAAEASFPAELKAAREIATSLEGSRRKSFEVAMMSTATLLGGVAGAIVSIIVR